MNTIVIMLDSLRPDHLGCYGNRWIKTPNIDRFSEECAVFERAYAEGLPTLPVRTALFTGRYTLPFRGWQRLEPDDVTIAEILWDKGFMTALVSDTYHMHKPGMAYERGFDHVEWVRGQEADPYITGVDVDLAKWHPKNYYTERDKRIFVQYLRNRNWWRSGEDHFVARVMKAGARWLEDRVRSGRRNGLFLWIDSFDPHEPWDPPEEYYWLYAPDDYAELPIILPFTGGEDGGFVKHFTDSEIRHIRAQYAGEVSLVDKWVGWFLERVKGLGLWENTMIMLVSDHGEPLGEHGIIRKVRPWPYEELSRIVLMVRHPGGVGRGKRIKAFVETVDVMPTILDFMGVNPWEKRSSWTARPAGIHGRSLVPLMTGEVDVVRESAISGHYRRSWSIRMGDHSLYAWPSPGAEYQWGLGPIGTRREKSRPELYRTNRDYVPPPPKAYSWRRDLAERENIFDEEKDLAEKMELAFRRKIMSLIGYD